MTNLDNTFQVDFSHRLEEKDRTDNEIDRLFHSIGYMTERAESVLTMMLNSNITVPEAGLIDSVFCEVKDIRSAVGALHCAVDRELESLGSKLGQKTERGESV